jgi:carbonic anhydrase/acetyltransferase-like protein (isoleucine patch superfamily)
MVKSFNGKTPKIAPTAFVSESAYVVGDVEIADGASVWPGAVVRGDFGKITIGRNTAIEDGAIVHGATDLSIGDDCIIGHGAVIHCRRVGSNVLIGNNATILDGAEVGNYCIIAAGSLVPPGMKIPDESLVMGNPAKIKGKVPPERLAMLKAGAGGYARLAQQYKEQGL